MRRAIVAQLAAAGIGAGLWVAAMLLPYAPQAQAQSTLLPHLNGDSAKASSAGELLDMARQEGTVQREVECLALNVYWEARGEPMTGKYAVAAVTLNRAVHPSFPASICQVVRQGVQYGRNRCQFSWACDQYGDRPRDRSGWELAQEVAHAALFQNSPDPTGGALYFHATRVRPSWSRTMVKVGRIGGHIYYRGSGRVAETAERDPSGVGL